jgi:uncharacterized membrane protein YdjX (TVP38/TMEM64 family)
LPPVSGIVIEKVNSTAKWRLLAGRAGPKAGIAAVKGLWLLTGGWVDSQGRRVAGTSLMQKRSAAKIILSVALVVVAIGLTYFFVEHNLYRVFINKQNALKFVRSFGEYSILIFLVLQILQVVVPPIPGDVTGIIGGYLYGSILGTVYSTIGLVLGSCLAFGLARIYGLPFVEKALKPEKIKQYDHFMIHQGAMISFVLFLIPGFPKDFLCYLMGLSHMGWWEFILISTFGRLFGTVLLSVIGSFVRNNQRVPLLIILGIVAIILILAYFYRDRWLEMLKRKHS